LRPVLSDEIADFWEVVVQDWEVLAQLYNWNALLLFLLGFLDKVQKGAVLLQLRLFDLVAVTGFVGALPACCCVY
jgi:hypothetical protein